MVVISLCSWCLWAVVLWLLFSVLSGSYLWFVMLRFVDVESRCCGLLRFVDVEVDCYGLCYGVLGLF